MLFACERADKGNFMKLVVISHGVPPVPSGQSTVLYHLLRHFEPGSYCLVTGFHYELPGLAIDRTRILPANYYICPEKFLIGPGNRWGLVRLGIIMSVVGIPRLAYQYYQIIRREQAQAVVACTGYLASMPAARLAARWAGVRFYFFVMDYYRYQFLRPLQRWLARMFEPWIVKGADGIFVWNEYMRDTLLAQYRVSSIVLRPPVDMADYGPYEWRPWTPGKAITIVYTGSIYEAHFDAFRQLIEAIKLLNQASIELHLYTSQSAEVLAAEGISGDFVHLGYAVASQVPAIQRQADILFLPMAFSSPFPEITRTAAPGKSGEYMATGRPILVHAPPDSFLSWYYRQHDCGLVVDQEDAGALAEGISQLLEDQALAERLARNAYRQAMTEHETRVVSERFRKGIENSSREAHP